MGDYDGVITTADIEGKMTPEFVKLESTGSNSKPPHTRVVETSGIAAHVAGFRTGTGTPRYFHMVLMDTIAGNPTQPTRVVDIPAGGSSASLAASSNTLNPTNWLISAKWKHPGGAYATLPSAQLALTESGTAASNNDKFVFTPNFTGVAGYDATKAVKLKLKLRVLTEWSGWQTGVATNVAIRWRERVHAGNNLKNSTIKTGLHEAVHSFGLAADNKPDGTANPRYYFSTGGHCNYNTNQCIMYHRGSLNTDFCSVCKECIRGRNLSSLPIGHAAAYTG